MKVSHFVAICGLGLIVTLPVVILGVPLMSDDGVTHAMWYTHFSAQLWDGDLYPRWLMNMNAGLGSPVFFYYPPVPYFLTSLLRPFFSNDPQGLQQVGVSFSIALIASGISAYSWLRETNDQAFALVAALLYMVMPYHLAEIYIRGALAEHWAFVWMPLILLFTQRIINGHRVAGVGLAISYALLIMTHLPTALILSVVPISYVLLTADKPMKIRVAGITVASTLLGLGLATVYILPAILTQQNVFISRMTTGYFSYENWFLFSKWSLWKDDKIMQLLLAADMLAIACCSFIISKLRLDDSRQRINRFWFAAALTSVFMMTELSKPLWWIVTVLRKIQFPWRFNVILCASVAALLALALSSLKRHSFGSVKLVKAVAILLILVWIPAIAFESWRVFPQTNPDWQTLNSKKKQLEQSRDAPEYRPRWNQSIAQLNWDASIDIDNWDNVLEKEFDSLLKSVTKAEGHAMPQVRILEGSGQASMTVRRPREIDLHVETPTPALIEAPQFYYPNWTAQLLGETGRLTTTPSEPDGLVSFRVPQGNHDVQLRLDRSKSELAGQLISLASLVVALCLTLYFAYFKRGL